MDKQSTIKHSLVLNLIIVYNIVYFFYLVWDAIVTKSLARSGLAAIYLLISSYYGLWKMKRNWMYALVVLMVLSAALWAFYYTISQNLLGLIVPVLNSISIYWLLSRRELFGVPQKTEGAKVLNLDISPIILGIIILAIVIFFILLFSGTFG